MNSTPMLMIVAALALTACSAGAGETPSSPAAANSDVQGVRDGSTTLAVGQTLRIELPSNATTGYSWTMSGARIEVLSPASPFGQEVADPHEPGMVGVGGKTVWRFTAAQPGTTNLTFAYRRSWERDTPPAETATYRITVR